MKCPNCGRQIDNGSSFCVFCAERTSSAARVVIDTDRKSRLYPVLFAVIAAVTVFSVLAVTSVHRAFGSFRPGVYTNAESGVNGGSSDGTEVTAAAPAITGTDPDNTETADGQTSPGTEPEPVTAASETETAPPETDGETAEPETAAPVTIAPVTEIKETQTPVTTPPETTPPETTTPETTPPETTTAETATPETPPETTAPETTVPETGIPDVEVKTRGPVRIVDKDEFAGGPPDDPYVSEYLWLEAYCYNDWTTFLYGTMDPDYGVSKQIEDLEHRRLVYFRNGGGAVAAYSDHEFDGLSLLGYSLNVGADDPDLRLAVSEAEEHKRPDGWRGIGIEYGFDGRIDEDNPDYPLYDVFREYGGLGNVGSIEYEYREFLLKGAEHTVRVTVEYKNVIGLPTDDRIIQSIPWFFESGTFTYAEYVN